MKRINYIKTFIKYYFIQYFNANMLEINVFFYIPINLELTAKIIAYIIRRRLQQKYSINEILNKLNKFLDKRKEF